MPFFKNAPFIRLLLPLLTGILFAVFLNLQVADAKWWLIGLFIFWTYSEFLSPWRKAYRWKVIGEVVLAGTVLLLGIALVNWSSGKNNPRHFSRLLEGPGLLVGQVAEPVVVNDKTVKVILQIEGIRSQKDWVLADGKAIIYLEKDQRSSQLIIGDQLMVEPQFRDIEAPRNPSEFDYRKYLSFHLVYQQAYLKSSNWALIAQSQDRPWYASALRGRHRLIELFAKHGLQKEELGVASALVLGYKNKLEEKLKRSYSRAGAMHVLAVSGLHVGIIFLVFGHLFKFMNRMPYGQYLRAALLLMVLWGYALLTGLSPSVMRAATMFSFMVVGQSLNRQPNIYNSIGASAFVLLCFNPFLIMEVGFQLSYLAVLGIVYLQPKIYDLWSPRFWFIDRLWALSAVSVAAQLATFPISLYYFHQFPNYFLLSNLLVIPAATVVLYLGLLLFIAAPFPTVADAIGWLLQWVIHGLNIGVRWIESLPGALTNGISISVGECLLWYAAMGAALFYWHYRKIRWMQLSLTFFLTLIAIDGVEDLFQQTQRRFVVYDIRKASAFNFIDGDDNILFCSLKKQQSRKPINFHVQNHWFERGVANEKYQETFKLGRQFNLSNLYRLSNENLFLKERFMSFYGYTVYFLDDETALGLPEKMKVNALILSANVQVSIQEIMVAFAPDVLIVDSSNSSFRRDQWKKEAAKFGVPLHAVAVDGAFVKEW